MVHDVVGADTLHLTPPPPGAMERRRRAATDQRGHPRAIADQAVLDEGVELEARLGHAVRDFLRVGETHVLHPLELGGRRHR